MYLLCLGSHQPYHYSLLSVESVLGLVEDLVRMLLEYLCGDLFLAVSGQAVHYHSVGLSGSHYSVVELIALEYLAALSGFALLTHGSPYVCVNHVGVSGSSTGLLMIWNFPGYCFAKSMMVWSGK